MVAILSIQPDTFYKLDNASHAAYGFRGDQAIGLVITWLKERL